MKAQGYLIVLSVLLFSCSSPRERAIDEIDELENSVYSDTTAVIDREKVGELIDIYVSFADKYPEDPKSADYLYNAANVSMNLMNSQKAIILFDRVMTEYPDYEKNAECLFMKGFIYDNNLKDYDKAKEIYEEFLERYPDDEFADDARASINNLGKSLEEIIEEFEQKNQAISDTL